MSLQRRTLLSSALAGAATLALPAIVRAQAGSAHVVVIGGGFGGATAARYLKAQAPQVRVTLVEPAERFYTCPFSNLYLAGLRSFESIGHGYDGLRTAGIDVVHARAEDVDTAARSVRLSSGQTLRYDKLVLSPVWTCAGMRCKATTRPPPTWPRTPGRPAPKPNCCASKWRRWKTAAPL